MRPFPSRSTIPTLVKHIVASSLVIRCTWLYHVAPKNCLQKRQKSVHWCCVVAGMNLTPGQHWYVPANSLCIWPANAETAITNVFCLTRSLLAYCNWVFSQKHCLSARVTDMWVIAFRNTWIPSPVIHCWLNIYFLCFGSLSLVELLIKVLASEKTGFFLCLFSSFTQAILYCC